MGRRRCCCERECIICEDDFNRADSGNILPFIEKSGTWNIDDNRLEAVGAGLAYCPTRHPMITETGLAQVTMRDMQEGDEYILFINFDPDDPCAPPPCYEGVKFVCDNLNDGTLSLVGSGASHSQAGLSYPNGGDATLSLCRNHGGIYADISSASYYVWDCIDIGEEETGRYAGVENPGSSTVYFDDFVYQEHQATNPICNICNCECDDYCVPKTLLATFEASGSHCSALDGATISMPALEGQQPDMVWGGTATLPGCEEPETDDWELQLQCEGVPPEEWVLCNVLGTCLGNGWEEDACSGNDRWGRNPANTNCYPFSMRFGPFDVELSGLGVVCVYYITVTEAP